jgi:signal transduction histidine kinase
MHLVALVLAAVVIALAAGAAIGVRALRRSIIAGERVRLTRELHDALSPALTAIELHAAAAGKKVAAAADPSENLDTIRSTVRLAFAELHRVLEALRPPGAEGRDFVDTLQQMIRDLTAGVAIDCTFTRRGAPRRIPAGPTRDHLFRITREAVANALRHSGAGRIDVVIEFRPATLRIVVCDDGLGSGEHALTDLVATGHGIRNMQERAVSIGGTLSSRMRAGGGTELAIEVPA